MKQLNWFQKLAVAIRTKDEDALAKLADEAPDMPSDGMPSIPGVTINMNAPAQSTALPEANRTTTDEGDPNKDKTGTGDEEIPDWAKELLVRMEKLEGKTTDGDPDPNNMTTDEDEDENRKVTGDAAFKRNLIADAEIICPGFQPAGDKSLKRQVLNQVMRTGDSLKAFNVDDFSKAPKATVDAVFTAALTLSKAKNHLAPLSIGTRTTDSEKSTKHLSPAELNKFNADFWAKNK